MGVLLFGAVSYFGYRGSLCDGRVVYNRPTTGGNNRGLPKMIDWRDYKNFSKHEFDCKHTGENKMRPEFVAILQQIRTTYGKPMAINSGYRDFTHPLERAKLNRGKEVGAHTYGVAADISVSGEDAMALFVIAYGYGIRRLGVYQKGQHRFIHLDIGDKELGFPPALWTR